MRAFASSTKRIDSSSHESDHHGQQKNIKRSYRFMLVFYPVMNLFFPGLTLNQVGRAMIRCAREGAPKQVLEPADIAALSG